MKGTATLRRATDRLMAEHGGLTRVQLEILSHLSREEQGLRMYELADRMVHSRSGLTYQVSQLEKKGLVLREHGAANERAVVARITEEGATVRASLVTQHRGMIRDHFVALLEPEELATVADAMRRVIGSFDPAEDRRGES
jgi:DNA-binding MarR family transcriptional regulator